MFFMASHHEVKAQWIMGGEITWECTPQGNYRFIMKLYRDCAKVTPPGTLSLVTNVPGLTSIQMNRITTADLSPQCSCPGDTPITCATTPLGMAYSNLGAIEEHVYTSDQMFPNGVTLTGVPPATGWYFAYTVCCRNASTNISNTFSTSFFVKSVMYPFQGTPVNTCFDNSPRFLEPPATVICKGYPFAYNYIASDPELDSLVYSWAQPFSNSATTPITSYAPGYTWDSPFPGTQHNPGNVAPQINPHTGEITLTSFTTGAFITVVKVTAYKSGIKVAEVYRDFHVALLDCGLNDPPTVPPPFPSSSSPHAHYQDTVYAGDLVSFVIGALDTGNCPNSSPPAPQIIQMYATGGQFGAPINPGGCLNPPCATLTPSPGATTPLSAPVGVSTTFNWQTSPAHLPNNIGYSANAATYNFLFKVMDNFCPYPGVRNVTVSILVKRRPPVISPPIRCVEVMPNGDVLLTWTQPIDTMNLFDSYQLWYALSENGPFTLIDTIPDITIEQYLHVGANADQQQGFYRIMVRSGSPGILEVMPHTGTAATIWPEVQYPGQHGASFTLNWNHPVQAGYSSGNAQYQVWRKIGSGSWMVLVQTTDTLWHDMQLLCSDTVAYRIELVDTANPATCRSISNLVSDFFENTTPPQEPTPHLVTVDETSGQSRFSWFMANDDDAAGYLVTTHQGGILLATDTIWNLTDTTWSDSLHDPCNGAITYHVHTFDICGNVSAPSQPHNTIFPTVQYDAAQNANQITWNPYPGLVSGAGSGYSVWYSLNGGTLIYLVTVSPQVTQYTHTNLTGGDTICYTVVAYGVDLLLLSRSCEVCADVPTGVSGTAPLRFTVGQNIPNPATGQTLIPFTVPDAGRVELVVRNLAGQTVWESEMHASSGKQYFPLKAETLPQGVYLYTIHYQGAAQTRRMTVK
jgi:hypothetical protein